MHYYIPVFFLVLLLSVGEVVAQQGRPASPVVVSKVVSARQAASKSFVGTLVPIRKSIVGSAVDGRVVNVFVDEGDPVTMREATTDSAAGELPADDWTTLGQPVVQLRTVSLDIEIDAAEIELRTREQAEKELQQTLPTEIDSAQAAVAEIKARLKYSEDNFKRLQNLEKSGGGISGREIDEAYSTYSSQSQLNIAAQTLLTKLTVTRESRLSQARASVEAQQAEIRRLKELREKYTIRAPFSGYVTSKMTEVGQWVARGEAVMEIVQLDPIELMINVPQSYIGELQNSLERSRGAQRQFAVQVMVDDVSQLLVGEVVRIVPQADLRSRSFPVKIRVRNPSSEFGHLLKSGMLARASLFIGSDDEILLVKKDALVLGGRFPRVFVVRDDPATQQKIVVPVGIEVGAAVEDWIEVRGGLAAGDQVVVEGNERLGPGQNVQIASVNDDQFTPPGSLPVDENPEDSNSDSAPQRASTD